MRLSRLESQGFTMSRRAKMADDKDAAPIDPLTEEALAWLVKLHSGEETEADWNSYHDWKAADAAHAEAAQRAERMWSRLGPALSARRTTRNITGALLLMVCLAGGGAATGAFGPLSGWLADEATGVGERRVVTLADGSTVTLDSATSLDIEYAGEERRIVLRDGQIFVSVAPDPTHPFIVEARHGTVQALGTAFNVRAYDTGARVAVTEHAVRVTYGGKSSVDVRQGEGVGYAAAGGLGRPGAVDTEDVTAWRHGEIVFDNRPLGEVAGELGRYRRGTVVFADAALKDLPVTGVFSTADTDAFFAALELTLPVRVTRLPLVTLIQRDPARGLGSPRTGE
jgi:transmembrane sensor